jgi:hypothetical protein
LKADLFLDWDTPPQEKITKNEGDHPGLFFNCILDFENDIS